MPLASLVTAPVVIVPPLAKIVAVPPVPAPAALLPSAPNAIALRVDACPRSRTLPPFSV